MRWYTKLVLLLLVAALVLPFWLRTPDGRPLLAIEDWLKTPSSMGPVGERARELLRPLSDGNTGPGESEIAGTAGSNYYSWQDESGVWHFSDQPPEHLALGLQPQPLPEPSNWIGAPALVRGQDGLGADSGNRAELDSSIGVPLPAGVSREAIETLLQEAHERRMGGQR